MHLPHSRRMGLGDWAQVPGLTPSVGLQAPVQLVSPPVVSPHPTPNPHTVHSVFYLNTPLIKFLHTKQFQDPSPTAPEISEHAPWLATHSPAS